MRNRKGTSSAESVFERRAKCLRLVFIALCGVVIFRLFTLQVVNASFYQSLAAGQHEFYQELIAQRGTIHVRDWKDTAEYVAAKNESRALVYADPRKIEDPLQTTMALARVLGYDITQLAQETVGDGPPILQGLDEEVGETDDDGNTTSNSLSVSSQDTSNVSESRKSNEFALLLARLSKEDDPYEPIARNVGQEQLEKILALELPGVAYVYEDVRAYPERKLGGHIFGFVSQKEEGMRGQYGLEGRFHSFLSGTNGFLDIVTDNGGNWIGVGKREFEQAQDGGNLLLTIDRTIQYMACRALEQGVERYRADSGSVVIIEPSSGKIMAMCNMPDFDPNTYNQVTDISVYNNKAIFDSYEPGSVFKPIVMSAALDAGAVTPSQTYTDTGEVVIDTHKIRNSDLKAHGVQTMTQVLESSLNTGMIYVMRQMSGTVMTRYIENFGFGVLSGIELDTEVAGTIKSLYNDHEIYYATASYGQGITATVLQLAMAYGALANDGWLMEPYIVEEKRYSDGTIEDRKPKAIRQVIDETSATTIGAMLVSVVENGHAGYASVPGYYIAGKTGTAQVAGSDGRYQQGVTMATFAGFGPIEDPRFVMVVRLDHPKTSPWASDTAAPIFGEIAEFILDYLEVPPSR